MGHIEQWVDRKKLRSDLISPGAIFNYYRHHKTNFFYTTFFNMLYIGKLGCIIGTVIGKLIWGRATI
jgi:hypothetical protein